MISYGVTFCDELKVLLSLTCRNGTQSSPLVCTSNMASLIFWVIALFATSFCLYVFAWYAVLIDWLILKCRQNIVYCLLVVHVSLLGTRPSGRPH